MILIILFALLAILVAFVYSRYYQDLTAARARVSSWSKVVSTPRGLIEYADAGTGPPIPVIHGAGGSFDQGLDLAGPLVEHGVRILAVSRFAYLRTPLPPDASPEAQADAYACLLDALNLDRVRVIGGSAGAPSAMQLCLHHPERCSGLVLLFPLAFAPRPANEPASKPSALLLFVMKTTLHWDFIYWTATKLPRSVLLKTILATPPEDFRRASANEKARALEIMHHSLPISQREKGIWNDSQVGPSLPRYDLDQIRVPTLVISAEDDLYGTFRGARYTADNVPGARFTGFSTGGHLLLGHRHEVFDKVSEFLSQSSAHDGAIAR